LTASRRACWIELGEVPAAELHAICLAYAETRSRGEAPAVLWVRSAQTQLCLGAGQASSEEADLAVCRSRGVAVTRRCLGGGTVLVDPGQYCFFLVDPRGAESAARQALTDLALDAAAATYRGFGVACRRVGPGDLWAGSRKLLGSGGASVGACHILGASFLCDFDRALFAALVKVPSEPFRAWLKTELDSGMTCWREQGKRPRASRLRAAFLRNLEAHGDWRFREADIDIDSAALRGARRELGENGAIGSGRRIPWGIKVNQCRYLVEHGPVRAVLDRGRLLRLAVDEAEVAMDAGIDLNRNSFAHHLGRRRGGHCVKALWEALSLAARGTQAGA